MLRLAAICDVSDVVRDTVVRVHDKAGRHIRKVVQLLFYVFEVLNDSFSVARNFRLCDRRRKTSRT